MELIKQRPTKQNRAKTRALARRMREFVDRGSTFEVWHRTDPEQFRTHQKLARRLRLPIEVDWIRLEGRNYIVWIRASLDCPVCGAAPGYPCDTALHS